MTILSRIGLALRRYAVLTMALGLAAAPAAAQTRRPIEGAEDWGLADHYPGVAERSCTARISGPEANTTLIINNVGLPVLMIGRGDWNIAGAEIDVTVSIDGGAPVPLRGSAVVVLVLVLISDPPLLARLRRAHMLEWTFPFGRFHANVTGFGTALDAVRACGDAAPATGTR